MTIITVCGNSNVKNPSERSWCHVKSKSLTISIYQGPSTTLHLILYPTCWKCNPLNRCSTKEFLHTFFCDVGRQLRVGRWGTTKPRDLENHSVMLHGLPCRGCFFGGCQLWHWQLTKDEWPKVRMVDFWHWPNLKLTNFLFFQNAVIPSRIAPYLALLAPAEESQLRVG